MLNTFKNMPYYPKSRIIENQTANAGEFTLPNGKDYNGPYYITFDGKTYTGSNPYSQGSVLLTRKIVNNGEGSITQDENLDNYNNLKQPPIQLIDPTPYTPKPTEEDYKRGKITRYFARQRNGTQFKLMEINQQTYDNMVNNRGGLNTSLWKVISIFWQITGPFYDQKVDGIRTRAGIIDTNQRVLDNAEKNFIGIKQYLTDLQQFAG